MRIAQVAIVLVATSSLAACTTYSVRRSALVPAIAPAMRSGAPMDHSVDLTAAAPTLLSPAAPRA